MFLLTEIKKGRFSGQLRLTIILNDIRITFNKDILAL
jgi:hypothetical protein